ncbi:MAG: outer membrane lipoprotein-sorting protein [Ignavibacteriales bacterium]|nr:outer membrane lipoprotein-sorting protein [Ignavibacteriales bacterium]
MAVGAAPARRPTATAILTQRRREHGRRTTRSSSREMIIRGRRGVAHGRVQILDPGHVRSPSPSTSIRLGRGAPRCSSSATSCGPTTPATRPRPSSSPGHMLRQSVMGSDLSYEDMMEDPAPGGPLRRQSSPAKRRIGDRPCWVLALSSRGREIAYHTRKIWVDKERDVVLREERFAKSGKLLKTTEVLDVQRIEGTLGADAGQSSRTP